MDDLDRMFRRLVQNIRSGYPEYLSRPIEVSELYQNLIPYRHNRRELEIETNQDYEAALCRLLSGERGYLIVDGALAEAMRRELTSPNPNTAIFREFAATRVALAPEAQRRWQELGGDLASAPTSSPPAAPPPPPPPPAPAAPTVRPVGARASMSAPVDAAPAAEWSAPPPPAPRASGAAPAPAATESASGTSGSTAGAAQGGNCRYCGGTLPIGRRSAFCPHCGQNLTIQRCPACGTELELNWKYCITCGRGVGAS
ncbi:MAG TPA: zinc ribbon domain-containing protein [Gemmatimonadaceae bacterium]